MCSLKSEDALGIQSYTSSTKTRWHIKHLEDITYTATLPLPLPTELISFVLDPRKAFSRCVTTFEHLWTPVVRRSISEAGGEDRICGWGIGLKLCLRGPVGCWVIKGCERFHALEKYFIFTGLRTLFFDRTIGSCVLIHNTIMRCQNGFLNTLKWWSVLRSSD